RNVARLRLDDGERRERAARVRVPRDLEIGIVLLFEGLFSLFVTDIAHVDFPVDAAERAIARRDLGALLHDEIEVRHLRRALEEARVNVEDVARIRFAPRRTPKKKRELAVR